MIKLDETLNVLHDLRDPEVRAKHAARLARILPDHDVVFHARIGAIEIIPRVQKVVNSLKPTLVGLTPV